MTVASSCRIAYSGILSHRKGNEEKKTTVHIKIIYVHNQQNNLKNVTLFLQICTFFFPAVYLIHLF